MYGGAREVSLTAGRSMLAAIRAGAALALAGALLLAGIATANDTTVTGTVFRDIDYDGTRDSGEPAVRGISVALTDQKGTVLAGATTGADGQYRITIPAPAPANLRIEFGP